MAEVLILGGYGNFGKRIAQALSARGVRVIIAGRDLGKAKALAASLSGARAARIDIHNGLEAALRYLKPAVVIHTCGPFQGSDSAVARACLRTRCHYIDLADARDFVRDFSGLDAEARAAGVTLISGASTVPGLSSAVIEYYRRDFARLDALDFGISPGQKAERGLATTRAIMGYVGRPLRPFAGHPKAYGWQDVRRQTYPVMGARWLANCDIPDLDLLPSVYGLSDIRFGAGLELAPLHLGLWAASWLVRWGQPLPLERLAAPLLRLSDAFNAFGSDVGGMHMILRGEGHDGAPLEKRWFLIAEAGDGPQIPCVPAILLAQRLYEKGPGLRTGAYPCVGLVGLDDYIAALRPYAISVFQPPRKSVLPNGTPQ
jgi:hypothetical protein